MLISVVKTRLASGTQMEVACLTNKNKEDNIKYGNTFARDALIAGVCSYILAICTLPSSGIATTLPCAFVLSVICGFLCRAKWMIYAFFTAMPLLINCLYGFSFTRSVALSVISLISTFFGILTMRAIKTFVRAKKNRQGDVVSKSCIVLVISVCASVFLWLYGSGNPVSALIHSAENKDYIAEKYADAVETSYTYFDIEKRLYLTKITFPEQIIAKDYYVSYPALDDYENYCLDFLENDAKKYFKGQTTLDTENVRCYLDVSDKVLSPDSNYRDYLGEFEYLIEISDEITGLKGFRSTCDHLAEYINLSETFEYKSVTFFGKDLNGNSYFTHIKKEELPRYVFADEKFEKEIRQRFYS